MATAAPAVPAIFGSLSLIAQAVSKDGIAKSSARTNAQDKVDYYFRGIDDVTWVMSGLFSEHKVLCVPSYSDSRFETRKTKHGEWQIAHTNGTFTFTSLIDGSTVVGGPMPGEAGDTGDKAMSKACSISLRNFLLQAFLAPIGPEMDPESSGMNVDDTEQPPVQAPLKAARAVQGEVVDEGPRESLPSGQLRVLSAKLKSKSLTMAALEDGMGTSVTAANFNQAMAWINNA